jgi:protein-tyrosine phosphatase
MSEQGEQASHLDIDGCFNVRDAGGWPTEDGRRMTTGLLYRADDPVRLTDEGRARIAELGLHAVIDLRQQAQFDRGYAFGAAEITHHIPTVDRLIDLDNPPRFEDAIDIVGLYEDMIERGGSQLVHAVDAVAQHIAEGPVLVHCVAGKDRTGLVVALIQAAIGVTVESIVAEYALSDVPTQRRREAMIATPLSGDPPVGRSPVLLWSAPAEVMTLFARRITELHGSMAAWPAALGVSPPTIDCLRERLLAAT